MCFSASATWTRSSDRASCSESLTYSHGTGIHGIDRPTRLPRFEICAAVILGTSGRLVEAPYKFDSSSSSSDTGGFVTTACGTEWQDMDDCKSMVLSATAHPQLTGSRSRAGVVIITGRLPPPPTFQAGVRLYDACVRNSEPHANIASLRLVGSAFRADLVSLRPNSCNDRHRSKSIPTLRTFLSSSQEFDLEESNTVYGPGELARWRTLYVATGERTRVVSVTP